MNMIVVTFNYRVSIWGFLAAQEIVDDGDTNIGLLDQRKVMEWIQKYISLVSAVYVSPLARSNVLFSPVRR